MEISELSISLDLPQISPTIDTSILKITHKLRLILKFVDSKKERNMSLSFPLSVGTVPTASTAISNPLDRRMITLSPPGFGAAEELEEHNNNYRAVHVRQQLDQWLFAPDYDDYIGQQSLSATCFGDSLPTYLDVLTEGNPPSPFIEQHI